jgi:hypothetical protein
MVSLRETRLSASKIAPCIVVPQLSSELKLLVQEVVVGSLR